MPTSDESMIRVELNLILEEPLDLKILIELQRTSKINYNDFTQQFNWKR
jgi:hypothetical protein